MEAYRADGKAQVLTTALEGEASDQSLQKTAATGKT